MNEMLIFANEIFLLLNRKASERRKQRLLKLHFLEER